MPHDVFISYSSHDKTTADAVCAVMEHRGIRCWMAPRDITPGADWATSIIQAINTSSVFLLIFSEASNGSGQVKREVERAANRNLPIIPFRITDMAPNESLEFFISTPHWLDAFTPPLHGHAEKLADTVERLIGPPKAWPEPQTSTAAVKPERVSRSATPPAPRPNASIDAGALNHGPFFLLASAVIGACAYGASLVYAGFWMNTPVYGVVVAFALWKWRKIGLVQAILWVAVMTGAHFVAYETAVMLYGKVVKTSPFNDAFSFFVAGMAGAFLSLLSLALLGRALATKANMLTVLLWTVILGVAGGLSGLFGATSKYVQLTLYLPWQVIFGVAILAVAQGSPAPKLQGSGPDQRFLPPASARGSVIFGVLAAAVALGITIANPNLFKKKDTTTPATESAAAADAMPAAVDAAVTPAATPEPAAPAPAPAATVDNWAGSGAKPATPTQTPAPVF